MFFDRRELFLFAIVGIFFCIAAWWLIPVDNYSTLLPLQSNQFPIQHNLSNLQTVNINGATIYLVATYNIKARVLSKHYYNDIAGKVAPVDLALAWSEMAQPRHYQRLNIWQSNRFFYWETDNTEGLPEGFRSMMGNVHIIPATQHVKEVIDTFKKGDVIHMMGYLVNVKLPSVQRPWKSSLTRNDVGNGACEIMYVTFAERDRD